MTLTRITPAGRAMLPIVCPLKFVQGFRCSRCPWARLLPDCHVAWAVPVCETRCMAADFKQHTCETANREEPFPILQ
ncbi:MAG: hypothetical protein ABIP12_04535 [Terriglobales bacterium]